MIFNQTETNVLFKQKVCFYVLNSLSHTLHGAKIEKTYEYAKKSEINHLQIKICPFFIGLSMRKMPPTPMRMGRPAHPNRHKAKIKKS